MDLNGFVRHSCLMFAPYCSSHESTVLLGYESVVSIMQTPFGPKVVLSCYCGELLTHDSAPAAVSHVG
jgi:hypothetical protein